MEELGQFWPKQSSGREPHRRADIRVDWQPATPIEALTVSPGSSSQTDFIRPRPKDAGWKQHDARRLAAPRLTS